MWRPASHRGATIPKSNHAVPLPDPKQELFARIPGQSVKENAICSSCGSGCYPRSSSRPECASCHYFLEEKALAPLTLLLRVSYLERLLEVVRDGTSLDCLDVLPPAVVQTHDNLATFLTELVLALFDGDQLRGLQGQLQPFQGFGCKVTACTGRVVRKEDTELEAATSSRRNLQTSRHRLRHQDEDSAEPQRECACLAGAPRKPKEPLEVECAFCSRLEAISATCRIWVSAARHTASGALCEEVQPGNNFS